MVFNVFWSIEAINHVPLCIQPSERVFIIGVAVGDGSGVSVTGAIVGASVMWMEQSIFLALDDKNCNPVL